MMDLILWRHAEAEEAADGMDDTARALTPNRLLKYSPASESVQRL